MNETRVVSFQIDRGSGTGPFSDLYALDSNGVMWFGISRDSVYFWRPLNGPLDPTPVEMTADERFGEVPGV